MIFVIAFLIIYILFSVVFLRNAERMYKKVTGRNFTWLDLLLGP